jgi:hypothetical protein
MNPYRTYKFALSGDAQNFWRNLESSGYKATDMSTQWTKTHIYIHIWVECPSVSA